ncbi:hypothetical protein B0H15DRAFT_803461 [Mycena belliarum]|uniref:Uncharacterized protein n=1 Tax=Mycena belliarum TaxID=1033014 RepID=A0AAD6TYM3_9AGAR|nr:hypothetical protein B0H15DRAFT_803461 [Mycena belliae]
MVCPARIRSAPGAGASKRRTRKHDGLKPGKVSWIHGTKLKFFASHADAWRSADEDGQQQLANFYSEIANLYILKYGYNMANNEDLAEDIEDPVDPNTRIPGSEDLTREEAETRSAYTKNLRKRIAAWYRRNYRGIEENDKNLFAELLNGVLDLHGPPLPAKSQVTHFYSRKYYEERIKTRYEAAYKIKLER